MTIETLEGDFLISSGTGRSPLLRIHMTDESMIIITVTESLGRQVIVADMSEAKELRDWLNRRLEEQI